MARYTGPKHRLARREGVNVLEKQSASLARRLNVVPGAHGTRQGRGKVSDYAKQLREKQKTKRIYGLLEKQFRTYVSAATKLKGKTGEALLVTLERRLDNMVYRLGLVPSRQMARQIVSHGHVMVDGTKVSIPSYQVKVGQVVSLSSRAMDMPPVKKMLEAAEMKLPDYVERQATAGRIVRLPKRDEIPTDVNEQLIIEYYSR